MDGEQMNRGVDGWMYRGENDLGRRSSDHWTKRTGHCQGYFEAPDLRFPGRK